MIDIRRFADDEFNYDINIDVKSDTKDVDKVIEIFDKLENNTNKYASRISNNFKNMLGSDATKSLQKRKSEMDKVLSAKHANTRSSKQSAIADINTNAQKELDKIFNKGSLSTSVSQVFNTGKSSVKSFNTELDNTVGKLKNVDMSVSGLSTVIKTSLLVQLESLFRTLRRTFSWMGQAFTAAGDYVESINLYTMSVGEYARAGERWATKISDALYLDTAEIYQYTGQFYNLTKGLGASAKAADLMSRNLTQLSYDMSSYLNIDVSVANNKLMSAMSGQTKAVTSVGVAVQAASLQELAYQLGIEKSVLKMTQAEKTYLRYIQIMKTTTQMQGDLGRTIITPTNAMRLLRTQMLLLARAVGQVLTPFIMEAIPYVMALTQVLKEAAESIAMFFGYDIKDYLADASDVTQMADWFDDVGESAEDAAAKINRTLAPFDELNVVAKQGAGKDNNVGSILPQLEKYLNGYDMLQYYTDKMKKKMEALKKPMKDVIKIAGVLIGMKALGGLVKLGKSMISVFKSFGGTFKSFNGVLGTLVTRFSDGYRYARALGAEGLPAVQAGIQNLLGPWGKLALSIGTTFAAFKTGFGAFSDYAEGTKTLGDALLDVGVKGGLLVGVAMTFAGPWAALATGIGLAVGAVDGYYKKINEMKVHEAVFDGHGTKIEAFTGRLSDMFKEATDGLEDINRLAGAVEEADKQYQIAEDDVELFIQQLSLQDKAISESQIETLKTKYDKVKQASKDMNQAQTDYYVALIKQNAKIRGDSDETANQQILNFKRTASARQEFEESYIESEQKLTEQWANGKISADEYAEKIKDLKLQYGYIKTDAFDAGEAVDLFGSKLGAIDYQDTENLAKNINNAKTEYQDTIKVLEEYKENLEKTGEASTVGIEEQIKNLEATEKLQGSLTENQQLLLDTLKSYVSETGEITKTSVSDVDDTISKIQGEYKGFLAGVYADLIKDGADTSKEFNGVIDTIKTELKSLKDTDMSGTGEQIYKSMEQSIIGTGNQSLITKLRDAMKKVGVQGSQALMDYLTPTEQLKENTKNKYKDFGKDIEQGIGEGIKGSNTFSEEIENANTQAQKKFKALNDIHSPSGVYESYGIDIVDGLAIGIKGNKSALRAIQNVASSLNNEMNKINVSFSSSGFEKSLDSLLSKLQTFSNKFSSGINSLLSSFTSSMNNITIGSDNKVRYNRMPNIKIPRFDGGGYPDSASLFYMNENGIPEMLGNIGNKTAVVNNDQIITSMTNALVKALAEAKIGQQKPGTTVVNIGAKKVYEGVGDYVDSENDRYGTSYVHV